MAPSNCRKVRKNMPLVQSYKTNASWKNRLKKFIEINKALCCGLADARVPA